MGDILQLNSPLFNIMKALGQGGTNFLGAKSGEEDKKRSQDQEDLRSFLALMPYLNGGGAGSVGPNGELFPAKPMGTPKRIQDIVSSMTGMPNPIFGPTAAMREGNAKASLAEGTLNDAITQSKQGITLGSQAIVAGGLKNSAGQYDIATTPVKDKQTYIAKEAPNWVSGVISDSLLPTDKNRQAIIQQAYKSFNTTAPDTLYKSSVRPEDFAGAVDAAITEEKKLVMDRAKVAAYARQVSQSGTPDYLKAASEMRMTLNNRLQDMKADKNLMNIVALQESGHVTDENALPPEIVGKYNIYKSLLHQSDALMRVQSDIMVNKGVPSKEGMQVLSNALSATGADVSSETSHGVAINNAAVDTFIAALRMKPKVAQDAKLDVALQEKLLTQEEVNAIRRALSGGKK